LKKTLLVQAANRFRTFLEFVLQITVDLARQVVFIIRTGDKDLMDLERRFALPYDARLFEKLPLFGGGEAQTEQRALETGVHLPEASEGFLRMEVLGCWGLLQGFHGWGLLCFLI
jgi:hypothetical protein